MRKRELKRAIIRTIREGEVYGYQLRGLLAAQGETVQLSYLYKTLKEMDGEGLLESRLRSGPDRRRRRHYRLTATGRRELGKVFGEAAELVHDFYEDYMSNLPPRFFSDRFHTMMREVYGNRRAVALITSESLTQLHREFLQGICARPGGGRTYLVKPPDVRADVEFPNLTVLDGRFDDLPMKDGSVDAMVVVDIQDATKLTTCCNEFRRVLKEGGIMCGCAPFLGLSGSDEPLDVGEFMKRMKYDLTGRPYRDREAIRKALAAKFDYVDVASLGFLTAFISSLEPIRTGAG